eukprot:GHVT01029684.1.p2 GENE.GHVT01029684.1~~GHVT01029684.1.p2  ORF type:complete len:115 (+),score=14.18 GHVT01029684.1:89-433(+)
MLFFFLSLPLCMRMVFYRCSGALTVFVGNVPIAISADGAGKRLLVKTLKLPKSKIVNIRFRSVPVHPKFAKCHRAALGRKEFATTKETLNAYVEVVDAASFAKAIAQNVRRCQS